MTELGAGVAILTAVLKLGEFLLKYANFLFNIRDKIESLKNELSWMQSFLEDAEKKLDNNGNLIRKWVSDVRDLAYECEDVIDTFLVELSCMQEPQPSCMGTMSRCFVRYTAKFPSTVDLGRKIDQLKTKGNDISTRRVRYGLVAADVSTTSDSREKKLMQLRRSAHYANDELMIGLEEIITLLKGKLTNGGSGRFVISILGMGGLGKTTLARNLYNSLRQRFQSYSWVCVSQDYNTLDILLDLIKSMVKPKPTKEVLDSMNTVALREEYLRNWLSGRRFLVVIDDVWEREAWESLERAFPKDNQSSRVIITTRNQRVADLNTAYVHKLRYLDDDESWKLFRKTAFPDDNEMKCPPDLKGLGKEMVTKCKGLPLAIITLGGLLSRKSQVLSEWELVRDNLWKELKKDSVHIDDVLLLSYNDLPQNLKQCFLYVGMFPEDFEIPISKLIRMWVAEGFIGQDEEGSPEETAKSYFHELVGRSLIQKKSEDWIDSTCRVHDLLRDMAIRKAKEMCFSLYYDRKTKSNLSEAVPHRRLTYMACDYIPSSYINPSLRTFCLWTTVTDSYPNQQWSTASEKMFQSLFECFSLLRVLDIQVGVDGTPKIQVLKIPGEIGRLIHLRYLGLRLPKVEFPETISNLKALETLSVQSNEPATLPKTVVKLKNLRHLIGRFDSTGDWIGKLTGLETLDEVSYDQWCDIDTTCLVNLHHVFVTSVPRDEANPTKFYDKFKSLTMLQTLALENRYDLALDRFSASEIFKRCPSITHFRSRGMSYDQSKDLHEFGVNLQVVEMVLYDLRYDDPIASIKKLPKLRALRIFMYGYARNIDKQLICSDGGFTQLRTLKIQIDESCDSKFVVKEGSLPSLTHLEVNRPDMLIVPDTLKQLIMETS